MSYTAFRAVRQLADAIRNGELSPVALMQVCLDRIDALNPLLNAFVALRREEALDEVAVLQWVIVAGKRLSSLAGLPIGVKDLESSGHPAASGRGGFTETGLPAGLQIAGPSFSDDLVLQAACADEQARPWNGRWPEL
jgi:Asp-tRNA(Asn)/Glu-tRNA(Gln) amidotransferase A subunit family amidase